MKSLAHFTELLYPQKAPSLKTFTTLVATQDTEIDILLTGKV